MAKYYVFKVMDKSAKKDPYNAREYAEKDHIEAAINLCKRTGNAVVVRWERSCYGGLKNPQVVY